MALRCAQKSRFYKWRMVVYEIFSHSVKHKYKTCIFSKASIFYFSSTILAFILPLLLACYSKGFWLKTNVYQEQPTVYFKHQMLLIIETNASSSGPLVWSTFPKLNRMIVHNLRTPFIKNREEDTNRDGKNDLCHLNIQVPLLGSEHAHSVKLLLIFDYTLSASVRLQMEAIAYIHHASPLPASHFSTIGELKLYQKEALKPSGIDTRFNETVMGHEFNLEKIFQEYGQRSISTYYRYNYPVWKTGRETRMPLIIDVTILYPQETILYQTGFWELLKWAWVQYMAISVFFLYAFHHVKVLVFSNKLFS